VLQLLAVAHIRIEVRCKTPDRCNHNWYFWVHWTVLKCFGVSCQLGVPPLSLGCSCACWANWRRVFVGVLKLQDLSPKSLQIDIGTGYPSFQLVQDFYSKSFTLAEALVFFLGDCWLLRTHERWWLCANTSLHTPHTLFNVFTDHTDENIMLEPKLPLQPSSC